MGAAVESVGRGRRVVITGIGGVAIKKLGADKVEIVVPDGMVEVDGEA